MSRGRETEIGSWATLILLLVSSSVVLGLQWNKECDGGLRTWLLIAICVTALCGLLGAVFHGKGDGTRPSRFLDDDEDDDAWSGVTSDRGGVSVSVSVSSTMDNGIGSMGDSDSCATGRVSPSSKMEEGRRSQAGPDSITEVGRVGEDDGEVRRDSMGGESIVSGVPSSISYRLATQSTSLQHLYFGTGPKVFPDPIFFILVVSQWFLAGWSVVGAALYFRLFTGNRTCSPLLRHWTLLVVIIGFLSCLLAVCYSGIMCCMLGGPFGRQRRKRGGESDFQGNLPSSGDGTGANNIPDMM